MTQQKNRYEPRPVTLYREALPPGQLTDFPYTALDRLGLPVHSATLWPENGDPSLDGLSYGTTGDEARIGAFGELSESVSARTAVQKMSRTCASYGELVSQYGESSVLDPVQAILEAGTDYDHGRRLDWVEAKRYTTGETVLVPLDLAASEPGDLRPEERGEERLIVPITNGLGAGPDLSHALSHGILELVQRDGNSVNYRAADQGVAVDLDTLEDEETRVLLDRLDADGLDVIVKLAATDFGMANLYVVGTDRDPKSGAAHPIMLSACGEAAHPDREKALRKALLEFVAARARKLFQHGPLQMVEPVAPDGYLDRFRGKSPEGEEKRALETMIHWLSLSHDGMMDLLRDPVLAVHSRVALSSLPHTRVTGDDRAPLLDLVTERLREAGFDVLYVDLSQGEAGGDIGAVHAIVPGLEVETMSYGRIGARNLKRLLDRDSDLVGLGRPPESRLRAHRVLLPEAEEERFGGPAWFDYDALDRAVGPLYPLYREPGRHLAPQVAESRGLL